MQFLNNDMDHLMRQAAELYEPPVTGADWQVVLGQLEGTDQKVQSNFAANSRRFLFLFTFLLFSLVCNRYLQDKWAAISRWNAAAAKENETINKTDGIPAENVGAGNKTLEKHLIVSIETNEKNVSKPFYPVLIKQNRNDKNQEPLSIVKNEKEADYKSGKPLNHHFVVTDRTYAFEKALSEIFVENKDPLTFIEQPAPILKKRKEEKLYIGLIAGIEGNSVKMKEAKSGWNTGVVLGYKPHSRWSIEAGLLWNKKNYYADGKYFNTDRINLPSHSTIIHTDGYCQMFEIPFTVRYTFKHSEKNSWFVGAGTSSYLMQKEDYDYLYERYGVKYYGNKYYKKSTQNWLATVNISGGYQQKIGQLGQLRIEPYIKIPVSGMGVGNLPITSAGVQAGLVLPIR